MNFHTGKTYQDIAAEDQGCNDPVAKLHVGRLRKEGRHEAEEDEHPQGAEQVGCPVREVVLGLACE
jgi:hypothetical protein